MNKKNIIITTLLVTSMVLPMTHGVVLAQGGPLGPNPGTSPSGGGQLPDGVAGDALKNLNTAAEEAGINQLVLLEDLIVNIVNVILSFLGIIFIVLIIYGGFTYMTAAGNQDSVDKGRKIIMYAAIGIAIIILSFAISKFITGSLVESTGGIFTF